MDTEKNESLKRRRMQNRAAQQRFRDKKSRTITLIRDYPIPVLPREVHHVTELGHDGALAAEMLDHPVAVSLFCDPALFKDDNSLLNLDGFGTQGPDLGGIDGVQVPEKCQGGFAMTRPGEPIDLFASLPDDAIVPDLATTATCTQNVHTPLPFGNSWQSPLHLAASKGHERIVRTLLAQKIDCNARDSDEMTPLVRATIAGHEDVAHCLLAHGACVGMIDCQGRSALHWAVIHQRSSLLKTLLSPAGRGRSFINGYDTDGMTPLHLAIDHGFEDGVELLLQCGACVHYKLTKT